MIIKRGKCVDCDLCVPYCPVGAIRSKGDVHFIDQKLCVECGACLRSGVCLPEALFQPRLRWPRILRSVFSDPLAVHAQTDIPGRGTEEMKTNDVTRRFMSDEVGIGVELGRPGISASFRDLEKVTLAMAKLNVHFEGENPVTHLIDARSGELRDPKVGEERVLSAIVELKARREELPKILEALKRVSGEIETVMSVDVITLCEDHGIPVMPQLMEFGLEPKINGKINLGLAWGKGDS